MSARSRDPLIKKYEEERELTLLLLVDVSGSKNFGTQGRLKSEVAAQVAGLLAYAASRTGDKVGVILFAGGTELVLPPKKGRKHVMRIIGELLEHEPQSEGTDLSSALMSAHHVMKHQGIVFIISDFLASGYEQGLKRLSRRNDVVAVTLGDRTEVQVPMSGRFLFVDPETHQEAWVDTGSYLFKKWQNEQSQARAESLKKTLRECGVDQMALTTEENYGDAVVRFFQMRARRKRN